MSGMIYELVNDASDATKPVSQLLRRMKVAAVRLKLDALESWVDHEISGYPQDGQSLPAYRVQTGTPMGQHVIHGLQPLRGGTADTRILLSTRPILQSLSSIEDLLNRPDGGVFWFPYPEPYATELLNYNQGVLSAVGVQLDGSRLRDIVDSVRDRILTWALSMESAGVTGEGMSFTTAEQVAAQNVTNNFYGDNARQNIGSTDNSTNNVIHGNLFGELKARATSEIADSAERCRLIEAIEDMEACQGTSGFASAYGKFIGLAANHMQLVQPFLERLTGMLAGG